MKAMVLNKIVDLSKHRRPLTAVQMPTPEIAGRQVLLQVTACGVCHTELDEIEGRTPPPRFPIVPGHQVVGRVVAMGDAVSMLATGQRVGVAWIYHACGHCEFCTSGRENLCSQFLATGRDAHGGYSQFMSVDERFAFPIDGRISDVEAAPLLCAGAIGYRSLRLTGLQNGQHLGLTGFGASAHLVLKLVQHQFPDSRVFVFARSEAEQAFARQLGAVWAGHTDDPPPDRLHAVIDTTPAWRPVVMALKHLMPGGRLVINAIRKEVNDRHVLQTLDYADHLWQEKEIKSVANVARRDVSEFLDLAAKIPIRPEVQTYPFDDANEALMDLKQRKIRGGKVLLI